MNDFRVRVADARLGIGILLLLSLVAVPAAAEIPTRGALGKARFLTGPQDGKPVDLATRYVENNRAVLGLQESDLRDTTTTSYKTRHNGTTHLYIQQTLHGIEVYQGQINVNIARDGSVINVNNGFIGNLAQKANASTPGISPEEAVRQAAAHFGREIDGELEIVSAEGGAARAVIFGPSGVAQQEIRVHLMYQRFENGARLAWNVNLDLAGSPDWWDMRIDADNGRVLDKVNWTHYDSYRVSPLPAESLGHSNGAQVVETDPADLTASPFGWHDTNGMAGAEFTDTRGNNVSAQDDVDANNIGGSRPDGGASLVFDVTYNTNAQPSTANNLNAAIINLFYWNNITHDILYHYGFDEAAGNFQENNYGNGGLGGDPVQADAQDGSGTDNANFATPPDGFDGRMQMFRWLAPPNVAVNSPGGIAGDYNAGGAAFGAALDTTGITGDLAYVDDGGGADIRDACEAMPANSLDGLIALIDRGNCEFGLKVLNAENAGAIAAIVVNNDGDGTINMGAGANGGAVTISSAFIGQSDGDTIKAQIATPVNVTISVAGVDRDSDFDNGVIAHEYGHGLSNRLTGGPANSGCLGNQEQMGEGWSDWLALFMTVNPSAVNAEDPRGIGSYVTFQPEDGPGIRNFPYSTDMGVNPETYNDIQTTNLPHGLGSIWAQMLWEMYWNLVDRYGYDADLYNGTGGNNIAFQLTIDGMKLQACSPSFVDGRDAILLADQNNYGGANQCDIWEAFAKRGLGMSADAGSSNSVADGTEAFDLPEGCGTDIFADGFESGDITVWDGSVGGP